MIINPSIAVQSMGVLNTVMPNVRSAMEGRDIAVSAMQTDSIISLLEAISSEASIELKKAASVVGKKLRLEFA